MTIVHIVHPDGTEQDLDLDVLVRSVVREELAALTHASSSDEQTLSDRELHIRALIHTELASLGGDLLSTKPTADPMGKLGGYMLERYGRDRHAVHGTGHAVSGSPAGG